MYCHKPKKITKPDFTAIDTTALEAQHDATWEGILTEQANANRVLSKLQENLASMDNALAKWPED